LKVTKRAKQVKIEWIENTYTCKKSKYKCPVCKTIFEGSINGKVTRFYCNCGQELICDHGRIIIDKQKEHVYKEEPTP
jgi:hypothetical protein